MDTAFTLTRSHIAQVNWKAVGFFYVLACGLSYGLHFLPNLNQGILPVHDIFTYGMGPLLAALITRYAFPDGRRTITVLGSSPLKTILCVLTPIALSVLVGVHNRAGQDGHLYGLLLGISGLLYGFGEEMGWRGWLQDALRPLSTFWRVVLIGLMHAGWHLTFLPDLSVVSGGQANGLIVVGILILMAWGMGALVDTTRSVLVVACAHELMNIAVHPVVLAVTLLVWIWLIRTWKKPVNIRLERAVFALTGLCMGLAGPSATAQSELMHPEGIEAMRAVTRSHSLTLSALDRPGSFAWQTPIRIKYSPFMAQKIEFDPQRPMTDYFQYVMLIRDSDMTEPVVP